MQHGVISRGNDWPDHPKHTIASVKDGTSNVMMIGEKFLPVQRYSGGAYCDDTGPFEGHDTDTIRSCAAQQTSVYGYAVPLSNPHQYVNLDDSAGNDVGWITEAQFGSAHPAGINAVFADGSVHNIKYGIDPQVFNALGNMDDGTNFHSDSDNIQ